MKSTSKTIDGILDAYLALVGTNAEAWSDLLAENAIMELPYAAVLGMPTRLEGKSAIYNFFKAGIVQMQNYTVTNVRKYPTVDPDLLWVEFHAEAMVIDTGRQYQQDYVVRIKIDDGKIVHFSDYFNPYVPIYAFGGDNQS
jgi:uncharacterized protein